MMSFNWATSFQTWIHSFSRGKLSVTFVCFNWATSFQTWIPGLVLKLPQKYKAFQLGHVFSDMDTRRGRADHEVAWLVSIGPRLFRHGYIPRALARSSLEPGFQLGHVFSDMDTIRKNRFLLWGNPFQLGHVFSDMDTAHAKSGKLITMPCFNWATSFQTWIRPPFFGPY